MVARINRKLSTKAVEQEYLREFINKELAPLVEKIRLTLDALQAGLVQGSGSPEGVVTANIGAIYQNQTGVPGSLVYVKTTDDSATGWVASI